MKCPICNSKKLKVTDFYKRSDSSRYDFSSCKKCRIMRSDKWRLKNPERARAKGMKWRKENHDRYIQSINAWYHSSDKQHARAANIVRRAVLANKLEKKPCRICKNPKSEAHHHKGYEKKNWLVVQWLCRKHHLSAHVKMRLKNKEKQWAN